MLLSFLFIATEKDAKRRGRPFQLNHQMAETTTMMMAIESEGGEENKKPVEFD